MEKVKLVLIVLLMMFISSLYSQNPTAKGRFITDLDFTLTSESADIDDEWDTDVKNLNYSFDLRIGYMIINNLELGIGNTRTYRSQDIKNPYYEFKETSSYTYYNLYSRYYFLENSKIKPFVLAVGGIGSLKTTETGSEDKKYNVNHLCGGVGVAYFFNDHLGLELSGQYELENGTDSDQNEQSNDFSSNAFNLAFGFMFSF